MFSRSFGFEHVHLRLSGGGARVDSLSRVENDRLDEALVVQIAERLAGKAAVDLQALADARDRDELAGRDLSQQLLIASGVKVDSVLGLFLDLTLGPLKRKITCQIVLFEVKIIAPNKNRFRKLN